MYSKVHEATHSLRRGPADLEWGVVPLLPLPEVHNQLLGLTDIQGDTVNLAPSYELLHFVNVGSLVVVRDEVHKNCVVSKLNCVRSQLHLSHVCRGSLEGDSGHNLGGLLCSGW